MPRLVERLTEAKAKSIATPGLHPDGGGLYLQITRTGARSWIYRFRLNGLTRDMGLGGLSAVSLVQARLRATECRVLVDQGIDPIEDTKAKRAKSVPAARHSGGPTFEDVAEAYVCDKVKELRNAKHQHQWRQTLQDYAYPVIGDLPVSEIGTNEVLAVLRPIWETKCETAMRLRGRIERILARATVEGLRKGDNPARWDGHLSEAGLPKRSKIQPVIHHAAMHYSDVPAFMRELAERDGVSADALSFLILTCARTGEVMGAAWPEVDWSQALWTVPAERAKSNRDHAVPLSTAALAVLRKTQDCAACTGSRSEFIFPGRYGGGLSQMTMLALLQRRMGRDLTVHGFRSAFRDWCGDVAGIERDLAEAALAHVVRDRTEAAYRRQTAIERRRAVMQQWADYCIPSSRDNVVDMVAAARRAQTSG